MGTNKEVSFITSLIPSLTTRCDGGDEKLSDDRLSEKKRQDKIVLGRTVFDVPLDDTCRVHRETEAYNAHNADQDAVLRQRPLMRKQMEGGGLEI